MSQKLFCLQFTFNLSAELISSHPCKVRHDSRFGDSRTILYGNEFKEF